MVSISGSKKLKRQMAPVFWGITRKDKRFVVASRPGPHPHSRSIPTAVFLRDMLGIVYTLREAKVAIYDGGVKVDGVVRRSIHHGIGLMDIVQLKNMPGAYKMIPVKGRLLQPVQVSDDEIGRKLAKVTSKTIIKGNRTSLGFHDGRTIIIGDEEVRVGDSCILQVPEQKILDIIPLQKDCRILVIKGANAGESGVIQSVEKGTFILPRRVIVSLGERSIGLPTDAVIAIPNNIGEVSNSHE
ncbi:MAG: 30S ribosomal protein S4e [Cenarchaeum sp. SB0665_bin_23]|nr:30S ribosomal protein S4e [Cenarchaeum sp. SB0667_bin_13]MXY37497.1 30S ribosomal protein S4e [Cenarchaeum sp. SB0664_bin_35]MXY61208.1 30S ribosomal protein S4e [Cenarchaeum sp. SB0665_bin_23]MXZ93919.1 30S ribosomal protein S4e [Cenarchaeum sp. SB0666_bin_15]MYB46874.1 30S ribosomal protein S4e [Cenarchaeum sp. SB0662_bin_33]MYC80010.1 30S ribosomal protein S4e [Cenarchaeum sp. SB0661_bin_35]MYD59382.1 30S ribosomal protein S4e [Cenarchaeum sp. SB0678_bin_8]MYG33601.1 30S ribosomal prot